MRLVTGALWLAWLAGCASAPVHYYTLSSTAPAVAAPPRQLTTPLSLERLSIPTEWDRTQLIRRLDATRLQILDDDRWAAPLDDMVRRVLTEDLALRIGSGALAEPDETANGERRASLVVDIRELYADMDCAVTLHAAWSLRLTPAVRVRAAAAPAGPAGGKTEVPDNQAAETPDHKAAETSMRRGDEQIHLNPGSCSGPAGLPPQLSQALAELSDRIVSALPR